MVVRRRHGTARGRDPHGQQHPRHRHGLLGGEANACGPHRRPRGAELLRDVGRCVVRDHRDRVPRVPRVAPGGADAVGAVRARVVVPGAPADRGITERDWQRPDPGARRHREGPRGHWRAACPGFGTGAHGGEMTDGDLSLTCARALVEGLADDGVRHACVSPGSRSTPIALALARNEQITMDVPLDVGSAVFFGLGLAKATGEPVAVACTSGTAAAEFFPAIVEASQSRTPLVVLTADRPPEVRGTGANQTIDQSELYGRYARAYFDLPVPREPGDVAAWFMAAAEVVLDAKAPVPGPVHINCPFDEPLTPTEPRSSERLSSYDDGEEWVEGPKVGAPDVDAFMGRHAGRRGVITLGGMPPPQTLSILSLGTLLGWPVLAEPSSGLRLEASDAGRALGAGQFLIGDEVWQARHGPDVVLQIGATPTTRSTQELVANVDTLIVLDDLHLDPDPAGRAAQRIELQPERFAATTWDQRERFQATTVDGSWLEEWRAADLIARATVDRELDRW